MLTRGHLDSGGAAPAAGEKVAVLVSMPGAVVKHILSAASSRPVSYLQDHDEWVVVLSGGALLEVGEEACALSSGDWVLLPAGVPHAVMATEQGTAWITVHAGQASLPIAPSGDAGEPRIEDALNRGPDRGGPRPEEGSGGVADP